MITKINPKNKELSKGNSFFMCIFTIIVKIKK